MEEWDINFISKDNFKEHVKKTIATYEHTLDGIDLQRFNSNIIDPIKMVFDSKVYRKNMEEIINDEIARQRDKTNTNAIGYFHQNLFKYIKNCDVPATGFDVIFNNPNGKKIFVEMKNKHNTMNSSSSQKTYMRMQNKILEDKNCECYLVEIISKASQNIIWKVSLDGSQVSNERIRRVSIDRFYEIVTGDKEAFFKICKHLPKIIDEILDEYKELQVGSDTVIDELKEKNPDLLKALYLLAFKEYEGFEQLEI